MLENKVHDLLSTPVIFQKDAEKPLTNLHLPHSLMGAARDHWDHWIDLFPAI